MPKSRAFSLRSFTSTLLCLASSLALVGQAAAQQVTGTLGSPSATTTIAASSCRRPIPSSAA